MKSPAVNERIYIVAVPNVVGKTALGLEAMSDEADAIVPTGSRLWRKRSCRVRFFVGGAGRAMAIARYQPTKAAHGAPIAVFEDERDVQGGEPI